MRKTFLCDQESNRNKIENVLKNKINTKQRASEKSIIILEKLAKDYRIKAQAKRKVVS